MERKEDLEQLGRQNPVTCDRRAGPSEWDHKVKLPLSCLSYGGSWSFKSRIKRWTSLLHLPDLDPSLQ